MQFGETFGNPVTYNYVVTAVNSLVFGHSYVQNECTLYRILLHTHVHAVYVTLEVNQMQKMVCPIATKMF